MCTYFITSFSYRFVKKLSVLTLENAGEVEKMDQQLPPSWYSVTYYPFVIVIIDEYFVVN